MQDHPATGITLQGKTTKELDFADLASVLGIENVRIINPFSLEETETVMKEELGRDGPSLVISKGPCALLQSKRPEKIIPLRIDPDKCTGCKLCLRLGCPAIAWKELDDIDVTVQKKTKKQAGIAVIDPSLCDGCSLCEQLCNFGAIEEVQKDE
jgi:indolepyruvate ferredoxin oxidoreductase alpha subunit